MSIINSLASSNNHSDDILNMALAKEIASEKDGTAIRELIENLEHHNKNIQSDCIKVLYEVAYIDPHLLSVYTDRFLTLLSSKNNRLQWGAMIALQCISSIQPDIVIPMLPALEEAADRGGVITRDHFVRLLIHLISNDNTNPSYEIMLMRQLQFCPTNQLPMYAESLAPIAQHLDPGPIIVLLELRLSDIPQQSKRTRILKAINKLNK